MREEFQADLSEVSRLLVTMAEAVRAALRKATSALLTSPARRRSRPTCGW
jgi:phosphate transport system protein